MNNNPKIGVFLCKCGQKIEPLVDLSMLKEKVMQELAVDCCGILPYPSPRMPPLSSHYDGLETPRSYWA
ncbi:MAG: hypothetical protein PF495_20760, partial [Spirochaetales bacterium]|nr:hypothetical protein [Spirochaetales bacterium]